MIIVFFIAYYISVEKLIACILTIQVHPLSSIGSVAAQNPFANIFVPAL